MARKYMKRVLIIGVLLNSAVALYAQAQQPEHGQVEDGCAKDRKQHSRRQG
jgi:hypothetical protein